MFLLGLIFKVFLKESLPGTLNEIFARNFKGIFEEIFKVEILREFLPGSNFCSYFSYLVFTSFAQANAIFAGSNINSQCLLSAIFETEN